jgi:hypothetical protein
MYQQALKKFHIHYAELDREMRLMLLQHAIMPERRQKQGIGLIWEGHHSGEGRWEKEKKKGGS